MARSGARAVARPRAERRRARESERGPHRRTEYSGGRRGHVLPEAASQAKWVFVFLALSFAVGFASSASAAAGRPRRQPPGQLGGTSGPVRQGRAEEDRQGRPRRVQGAGRRVSAGRTSRQAITAGEQYLKARPKDYEYMSTVAATTRAARRKQRDEATAVQDAVTASTAARHSRRPRQSKLGRALGTPRIDQELTDRREPEADRALLGNPGQATPGDAALRAGGRGNSPKDVLVLQLLLANSAYQSRDNQAAIDASRRVIKLAPGTQEARRRASSSSSSRLRPRPSRLVRLSPPVGGSMNFDVQDREGRRLDVRDRARGEVDLYTAPEFKQQLLEVIAKGAKDVIVDFSNTTFIDSTTLGVLVGGVKRLRVTGRPAVSRLQRPEHHEDLRDHRARPCLHDPSDPRRGLAKAGASAQS